MFLLTMTFQSCDDTEEFLPYAKTVIPVTTGIDGVKTYLDSFNLGTTSTGFILGVAGDLAASSVDLFVQFKRGMPIDTTYTDPILLKNVTSLPSDNVWTAEELAVAVGVDVNTLEPLDRFLITFTTNAADGEKYPSEDSYVIDVSCSSSIQGTYTAVSSGQSTDDCCPDPAVDVESATITISTTDTEGVYKISDFSGGLWNHWYGPDGGNYGANDNNEGEIKDVCNTITFQETTELFGSPISGSGTYDPDAQTITIDWTADSWGDVGTSVFSKK